MTIKILLFGVFTEVFGKDFIFVDNVFSVEEIVSKLSENFPEIRKYTYRISVNRMITEDKNLKLELNDEIALLPPFSGG